MTSLESIGKLRKLASNRVQDWERPLFAQDEYKVIEGIADAIEKEVDEKYMPLPLDADGVPIHVGDEMENGEYRGKVTDMSWDERFCHVYHGSIAIAPCDYTHVKPDKLKERVERFGREIADSASYPWREIVDELCADIREMAKEGEL